jgi:predicted nucleotidyltransferase
MSKTVDYLDKAVTIAKALEARGLEPVLIGGMALAILGSQRITNDFDFLISAQESTIADVVEVFYEQGLELVSKLNKGEVTRTIDNKNVAIARLKLDSPSSAYFFDPKTQVKIDLLFDFPLAAKEVAARANKVRIKSSTVRVASTEDLIRLKELAYADRRSASDAQDLDFLKRLLKPGKL